MSKFFTANMGYLISICFRTYPLSVAPVMIDRLADSKFPNKFMPQAIRHVSDEAGQNCQILKMFWTQQTHINQRLAVAGGGPNSNTRTALGK